MKTWEHKTNEINMLKMVDRYKTHQDNVILQHCIEPLLQLSKAYDKGQSNVPDTKAKQNQVF